MGNPTVILSAMTAETINLYCTPAVSSVMSMFVPLVVVFTVLLLSVRSALSKELFPSGSVQLRDTDNVERK